MKKLYQKYKEIIKMVLCFIIFFFTTTVVALILNIFKIDYMNNQNVNMIASFVANVIKAILIFLLYFNDLKKDFKSLKENFWEYSDVAVKYWLIGLIVMAVTNVLINLFTPAKQAINEENVRSLIRVSPWLMLIITTITAPLSEELLFRKSFKNVISDKTTYIVISGLVFGALHVVSSYKTPYDLLYIIPYSSLGIAFAATCQKTNNIFPSMMVHSIHNFAITIVTIVSALSSTGTIL